jgi:hypothetical protein
MTGYLPKLTILQSRSLKELAQTASSKAPVSQREEKSGDGFALSNDSHSSDAVAACENRLVYSMLWNDGILTQADKGGSRRSHKKRKRSMDRSALSAKSLHKC